MRKLWEESTMEIGMTVVGKSVVNQGGSSDGKKIVLLNKGRGGGVLRECRGVR